MEWYPQNKKELSEIHDSYMQEKPKIKFKEINGIIVPHAGYEYSGKIAGKAFSLLKNKKNNLAIILSPSHYISLRGAASHNKETWKTTLGSIKVLDSNFPKIDISIEHAIDNQIPFLQKLRFKSILPLLVGDISINEAKNIAEEISKFDATIIVSSDLSHFLAYEEACEKDKETIKAIQNLNSNGLNENSACGIFPLFVLIELCKLKKWKPRLIEYKNSGNITPVKESVVGYASFYF